MSENVILVNTNDEAIGVMEKLEAHQKGLLHRAFSIFIFNSENKLLMQKRAEKKYHSGGLWTNTCCSHPRPGEDLAAAAKRRLKEEMGLATDLVHLYSFIYKVNFSSGLSEHELDHIFIGKSNDFPKLNLEEASEWKYMSLDELRKRIDSNPEQFTEWLKISYEKIFSYLNQ